MHSEKLRIKAIRFLPLLASTFAFLLSGAIHAAPVTAVEFYHSGLKHYFMTADPSEASGIDNGAAGAGWVRTGLSFTAWPNLAEAPAGASPVCRFYGTPGLGPNSHFYTADSAECAAVKKDPGWFYEGIAFYSLLPQNGRCGSGYSPVYRNYNHRAANNDSNHRFTTDTAVYQSMVSAGWAGEGVAMCAPSSTKDISRFLAQATFGPTESLITHVANIGIKAYITEQFNAPLSSYPDFGYYSPQAPDDCDRTCRRDKYSLFPLQQHFFKNALTGNDQLRQRVAFALSQVFVVSGTDVNLPYAMAPFQNLLYAGAFGNFKDLLYSVTLNPAMGRYLDMVNNDKPNPVTGTTPNENYAREILQLFSIGVSELNADGTIKRNILGEPIPSYDEDVIEGFAYTFTGWTFPPTPGIPSRTRNPPYFDGPMVLVQSNHDTSAKQLLSGFVSPAGQDGNSELKTAIDNIFMHPNVGPFIGKQLIQKLVTSNPSPGYVSRVTAAFNNNGSGVRGDMRAVISAILTDAEARGEGKTASDYGHLREPVLFITRLMRGLNAASDGVYLIQQSSAMGQNVFYAPSVFNFYPPDYVVPDSTILGPEFAIQDTSKALNRINFVNALAFSNGVAPDTSVAGATGTRLDLTALQALAQDPAALTDRLNVLLMDSGMSSQMRDVIIQAVNSVPASDSLTRVRSAVFLVATSSQFQVER